MTEDSPLDAAAAGPARTTPSADAVAEYLRDHPDFFEGREALLADMLLPHGSGGTVSLVERQLGILRERNSDMRGRLDELVRTARTNHRIFERTLEISASLLDATDEADAARRFLDGLRSGFEVDSAHLLAIDRGGLAPAVADAMPTTTEAEAREVVGNLMRPGRIVCGLLREKELRFLFGESGQLVASAAVMPVELRGGMLLIALGSADADHFTPDMGTLFIRFLGDALGQLLNRPENADDAGTGAASLAADDSGAA